MNTVSDSPCYNVTLGQRARAIRQARGLSPAVVAAAMRMTTVTLWRLETGHGVGSEALPRLARCLETSLDYLVGLSDDPRPAGPGPQAQAPGEADVSPRVALKQAGGSRFGDFQK